ncbi:hypothetical protein [Streptomyces sp. NPDC004788]
MERGERSVRIDNGTGVVVIGDGNSVVTGTATRAARSAYRERVRSIAPADLVGRERELAELADFCRTGAGYAWWRADAWAGKTALLSWFALNPPAGVRIVPFFVTARWSGQNDVVAFVDVVVEQLAELAGEPLPARFPDATRESHLLHLYRVATRACAARGERLVLLVDGLDEDRGVTTGPDSYSIAALLPPDAHAVVSGRLNPPLPPDVPPDHPLRDPAVVRILEPSPVARAIQVDAERELKLLLAAGGLPYDLLVLLTAAGGGLTADDLAELTGGEPYEVRDVLRTGPGRTFLLRGDAYLLAHEELAVDARKMLPKGRLSHFRDELRRWADGWRKRGWPAETPAYLLHGYVPMLRAAGDVAGMVDCALDAVRHDRLLAATGGDAAAFAEVWAASDAVLARGDRPDLVTTSLRLAWRAAALRKRNGGIPAALPAAWAALGETDRALALARGLDEDAAVEALSATARVLHDKGERARAREVMAETWGRQALNPLVLLAWIETWIAVGAPDQAERAWRTLSPGPVRDAGLPGLVGAWHRAGEPDRAEALRSEPVADRWRAAALAEACAGLAESGRAAEAAELARPEGEIPRSIGLLSAAVALRRVGGREEEAAALVAEALSEPWWAPSEGAAEMVPQLVGLLVDAGAVAWAEALSGGRHGPPETAALRVALATALARTGRTHHPWMLVAGIETAPGDGGRADVACAWAESGRLDALGLVRAWNWPPYYRKQVLTAWIRALVRAGRIDEAEGIVAAHDREAALCVALAHALADAGGGHLARAAELLTRAEAVSRERGSDAGSGRVDAVVGALADGGYEAAAERLASTVPAAGPWAGVLRALSVGRFDRAWRLVTESGEWSPGFARLVLRRCVRTGRFTEAEELLRAEKYGAGRFRLIHLYVRELLAAGEIERAMTSRPHTAEACADIALALHADGRREEADRWLDRAAARTRDLLRHDFRPLPGVVRALRVCGREREAAGLLDEAEDLFHGTGRRPEDRARLSGVALDELVAGLVAGGRYDEALDLARRAWRPGVRAGLVAQFARAGAYERAEALLAEMAPLGPSYRVPASVALALAHSDAGRARELVAHALRFDPWTYCLPAVVARAPEAVPVLVAYAEAEGDAEGDRLRGVPEV